MNPAAWPLIRWAIRIRRGRLPPAHLPDRLWYFAYGSNMNERLFRERRQMRWHDVRVGRLEGFRLVFSRTGGRRPGLSAPANIVEAPGEAVWGVLYLLPARKFARLDNSEGRQYAYLWANAEDTAGIRLPIVTYKVGYAAPEGPPSAAYLKLIQDAARERGLPAEYRAFLDNVEART